ncbi:MAG: molecular chaperone [Clostridium sp.]|nr:molecular chaperone [Clostridium sp.]
MENNRNEQMEALKVLQEFNGRLISNMKALVNELSGERLEDTDKLLKTVIDALNWEIQVVNATMDVLNEGTTRVDKESFNKTITALSEAVASGDDSKMAEQFGNVIDVFEALDVAVKEVVPV